MSNAEQLKTLLKIKWIKNNNNINKIKKDEPNMRNDVFHLRKHTENAGTGGGSKQTDTYVREELG